jgi:radical SAM protein with 4Fe4S-binding SPASM domain
MDGLGEDHDRVRNTPDIFSNVEETFHRLQRIKKNHRNLNTCIDITVSALNQEKLIPLYHHIRDDLKPDIINAILIRGNPRNPESKKVDIKYYEELNNMLESDYSSGLIRGYSFFTDLLNVKDFLLRDLIIDIHKQGRYMVPCTAGTLTAVIYPEGEVYPCELLDTPLGSLRDSDYNFRKIWFGTNAQKIRDKIKREKCYCIHQCFLSNNILFNPKMFPGFFSRYFRLKMEKLQNRFNRGT